MAKKSTNAASVVKPSAAPDSATGTTDFGASATVVVGGAELSSENQGGLAPAGGGSAAPVGGIEVTIGNSAPAAGDASAGTTEVGGVSTSSSEGDAASSEHSSTGVFSADLRTFHNSGFLFNDNFAAISAYATIVGGITPAFLGDDGQYIAVNSGELASVKMAKSVKHGGFMLEHGQRYNVPAEVYAALYELDALEFAPSAAS